MAAELLILEAAQKQFFDDNGYLLLEEFYGPEEMDEMRRQFHALVSCTENRPSNMSYSFMEPPEDLAPDSFNPKNVGGMMDQPLASDYWFDQFTEPRIVGVMVDLLGPNLDFHNGKVRNKPPGFVCSQSWHQDWPYERHTRPHLAAAITYLDPTDFEAGATEVLPGSHLRGEWLTREGGHTIADEQIPAGAGVVLAAEPGDVVIHHINTVHGSSDDRTRVLGGNFPGRDFH